ncbi:MAG: hypothetical protein J6Q41_05980, partial [Firmicutes bacterium]|nr:hypothetical protein [Bacillota bacterium]
MKKQILRSVVLIMSFVMIFAFVPFLGGGQKAYAAVYQNCEWVERITEGLKWSYYDDGDTDTMAFASYPLYVDNYSVMDRLGYDDTSYMTNSVIQWIYKPSFEGDWDILEETPLDGSEDGLMTMPNNLSDYGRLEIDIYDAYKNDCYCSRIILVSPRKVKDLIDDGPCELSFKNGKKSLKGQNVAALLNTLRICASQKKIDLSVIENNQYIVDANKDGKTDFIIKTEFEESDDPDDLYNDSGCYIEVKTNMVDYGAKLLNIKPDPEGTFGKYRGKYELTNDWSYNCWIRLNLPEKKISKASSSLSSKTLVYSGKSLKPTVTVKDKGKTLKAGKDYKVSGSRKNVGKGTVTITGLGQYTGTKKLTFK